MKHLFTILFSIFLLSSVAQNYNMNNTAVNTCSGTFYDSGGNAGTYGINESFTKTFCPSVAGSKLQMVFTTFNLENNFDFLTIYDGPNTTSPTLGSYTGGNGPGIVQATAANASGCLTYVFTSDGSVNNAGWAATISCITPCETINAVFNSSTPAPGAGNIIRICQGASVTFNGSGTFTSGSSTGANYSWNFDNGLTGSGQTATTTYTAPGVYVVNLNINKAGCVNQNKINQIVQVSTTPSFSATTTSTNSICLGQSATLIGSVSPTPFITNCTPPIAGTTFLPDGTGLSYSTSIVVDCYGSSQTVTSITDINNVCINMEHSYLGDLNLVIRCPNGQTASLLTYPSGGGSANLGIPWATGVVDLNSNVTTPGTGSNYCFSMSGAVTLAGGVVTGGTFPNGNGPGTYTDSYVPAGTYAPSASFSSLVGCPLNGSWTIVITDNIGADNGTIFNWDVNFNTSVPASQSFTPSIVSQAWSGASITSTVGNNAVITPTSTGTKCYTLTAVDNFGCSYTTVRCVTVTPGSYAGVSNTLAVCNSAASTNLFSLLGTGVATTGNWTGPTPALTGGNLGTFNPAGLTAGAYNYTYTVPGSGSCPSSTAMVSVTVRPKPSATLTFTNPTCVNPTGGIINIINTSSPLPAPAQSISSFASSLGTVTNQTVTGLGVGTPVITLTNNYGCTFTVSATLSITPGPTAFSLTPTNTTCGNNNGTLTFGAPITGGTAPYTYSVNGVSATSVTSSLSVGNYSVTIKDGNGCSITQTTAITALSSPTAISGSTTQASCNTNNGTFSVTGVSGGTAVYTYSLDGVGTSSLTTGLAAGTHTILVRDGNGCIFSRTFIIGTASGPSSFLVNTTNSNCGLANGTSTVSGVVGGAPTYSFSFDGGAFGTGTTASGLTAGNHTVVVKDINACTLTVTYSVSNNAPPTAAISSSLNVLCNGASTGSLTVVPTGGTGPYTYTLTSPTQTNTTGAFSSLPAGTYSITVKDIFTCTATVTAVISQPTLLTGTVSSTPVNCFGNATGSVSASGSGGVAPYTYLWPALGNSTLSTVGGVAAGTYTVTIRDANLCSITRTITVTQPTSLTLTSTLTPATCSLPNGSGTVTVGGGTTNYSYNWSNGGLTNVLTAASAGTYTLTVQDFNGCILTRTLAITNIAGPTAITGTTTLAGCGLSNGTYSITGVTGGTAVYTYSLDGAGTTSLTTGLSAGSHTILVSDDNSCTFSTTFNINTANGPSSFIVNTTNSNCGLANGTSTVSGVVGGAPTYSFSFDGGAFGTGTTASGLSAGNHTVVVKDINACTLTVTYSVSNNAPPTAAISSSLNVLCNGASTGSLTVVPTGGTAPYTYTLTNPTQTNTTGAFTSLPAGTYSITVKDIFTCTATVTAVISQPTLLTGTVSSVPVNCFGNATGSVSSIGSGGLAPYTYLWPALGNSTLSTVGGVAAGTYTVTIRDANLCSITRTITVTQPTSLTLTSTLTPATCSLPNGSATVTVGGGTSPYSYNLSNGGLTNILTAASAGTYTLTVQDFNGCILTRTLAITNIAGPTAITGTTTLAGCGLSNGTYSITGVTGGTAVYTYSVDGVGTTSLTTALSAGSHTILVSDDNSCTFSTTFNINTTSGPTSATVVTTNASCGTANGTATITAVTGGVAAYQYSFDGGAFGLGNTISGLSSGTHTVIIRDVNSCTLAVTYNLLNNTGPTLSVTNSVNINCFGENTGSITVTPVGGIAPFTYTLTAPTVTNTTGSFTGLVAGAYNIIVSDDSNCTATTSLTLTQPSAVTLTVTSLPVSCFGNSTGTVSASGSGGSGTLTYLWPALGSSTLATINNVAAGTYTVIQTDGNGCSISQSITVTQPTSLTLTSTLTPATCGNSNGSGTVTVSGGTPAYSYSWSNGGISSVLSSASVGTYTLNVTDFKSCVLTTTLAITNIAGPTAITGTTTLAGCGLTNGTYSITGVTGGTAIYSYSLDGVGTSSLTNGLSAGTHTVSVTDFNACSFSTTFNIGTTTGPSSATVVTTNATCGNPNGTATVTSVTGGAAVYQYSFDGGGFGLGNTVSGLAAGTHTVVIMDVNSCTLAVTYNLLNNSGPTVSVTNSVNINCFGGNTGSITVTPVGGIAPFTYTLTTPTVTNTTGSFTGLVAGAYNIIVSDDSGCTATTSLTLTQPSAVTLTVTSLPVSCFGNSTGTVSASGSGGSGTLTYLWPALGSSTLATINNVAAGTYTVIQTDGNGCSISQSITVTQPTSLTLTSTLTPATCGNSNGSGTVTVSGGTPAYSYSWSNGGISSILSSASAGTYTLNVTDFKSCILTTTLAITDIAGPTAITGTTTLAGCGLSNGTYSITGVTGGTLPFTFNVDGVVTSSLTSGLSAGTHTVSVTDFNGCNFSTTFAIGTTSGPSNATVATTNATCGNANGTATVTAVTGGAAAFQYSFDGGVFVSSSTTSSLSAGIHTVTIQDANFCAITVTYTTVNNGIPSASISSSTNTSCFGASNGGFIVAGSGGSGAPFTYTLTSPFQTNGIGVFTGLTANTYTVLMSDVSGCAITTTIGITQPAVVSLTATSLPALCFGGSTGTINVLATGGTGAYTYSLNGGSPQAATSYTAVSAGIYNVAISDANGCITSQTVQVNQPPALAIVVTTQNAICTATNGVASATVTGGTPGYTYSWTGNGGTASITNPLVSGTYTLTATDNNGCIITSAAVIGLTAGGTAAITVSANITCNNANDGFLTASSINGNAPYTYSWTPGGQTTATAVNLSPNTYSCTITDFYGCTATAIGVINQPPPLIAIMNSFDVKCFGGSTGTVSAIGSGGTFPYTYLWPTLASTLSTVPNVSIGNYSCVITDANGCSITQTIAVTEPTAISLTSSVTSANCNQANGCATVTATGGAPGAYTYTWSTGSNSAIQCSMLAGTSTITVEDANNCIKTLAITIPNIAGPVISIPSQTNVSCFGGNNGVATTSVSGGVAPYTYSWGNGSSNAIATNLSSNIYTVSATDQAGCVTSTFVTISQPTTLTVSIIPTNPKCFGATDGFGVAAALGGTPNYSYLWSDGGTAANSNQLGANNYNLTVTDANGCIATSSMALVNPPAIAASITATNVTCFGSCNGMAAATTTNAIGGVTYFWIGAANPILFQTATGLCAGTYTMFATDQNTCTASAQVIITEPPALTASISSTGSITCNGGNNGFAVVSAIGGTPTYSYTWSGAASANGNSANANSLVADIYTVTITDALGCVTTANTTILQPNPFVPILTFTDPQCNGALDGTANIAYSGGAGTTTFLWEPGLQPGNSVNNLGAGSQSVTITSNGSCISSLTFTLSQPALLTAAISATNSTCNQSNGQACAVVGGGTSPLTFQWSNAPTTLCNSNIPSGSYNFVVTDFNGCTANGFGLVSDISGPVVSITSHTDVSCFGGSDGAATAVVSGGVPTYTVFWSNGASSQTVTNFNSGVKSITVLDASGCIGTASVTILQPAILTSAIGSFTNTSCFGLTDGGATILANGGTTPYSYSWTPSAQTNSVMVNVGANTYSCLITDNNGCSTSSSLSITEPSALQISNFTLTDISCFGGSNGQISTTLIGGTPGYTYTWIPSQPGNNGIIGGLSSGVYSLTVIDSHACSVSTSFNLIQPTQLVSSYTSSPASCGAANGSATVTVTGGTPTYTVNWNTFPTQQGLAASNIPAGTNWIASITDSKGCFLNQPVTVSNAVPLSITGFNVTPPSCFGSSNGAISVNYASGSAPYTVSWSNPISQTTTSSALTQSVSGVASGVYTATLTDSFGCSVSSTTVVPQPPNLSILTSANSTICYGQTAQLSASASGGIGPYSYTWTPNIGSGGGPHNVNPTGLTSYSVELADVNGCLATPKIITIDVNPQLSVIGSSATTCHSVATIFTPTITSPGNGGPYNYTWSPILGSLSSLMVVGNAPIVATTNTYVVVVDDGCSAPATAVFTLNTNPAPSVTFTASEVQACAPSLIYFNATPGAPGGYTYSWLSDNKDFMGNTNPVSYNYLNADTTSVTLTITNTLTGCSSSITKANYIIINKPPVASFYASPQSASILDPTISFVNTSTGATSYYWDFGDPAALNGSNNSVVFSPSHSYDNVGIYTVHLVAKTLFGCEDIAALQVEILPDFALYIPNTFTPDGNGLNDIFQPKGVGIDEENYQLDIYDRWGVNIFTSTTFIKGWDGTVGGTANIAQQGVYTYRISVKDVQGGSHPFVGHVTLLKKEE